MPTPVLDPSGAPWEENPTGHNSFMEGRKMAKKKLKKSKKLKKTMTLKKGAVDMF